MVLCPEEVVGAVVIGCLVIFFLTSVGLETMSKFVLKPTGVTTQG